MRVAILGPLEVHDDSGAVIPVAGARQYLFLLNHSADEPASIPVPPDGTDLISGSRVSGPLTLPPLAVAILAYRKR